MNDLQTIIASKLCVKKLSGYDITKNLEDTTANSHQQVYRELEKLESGGLVTCELFPQEGKPDRKEYTISTSGIAAYDENQLEAIKLDKFNRGNFMVAINSSTDEEVLIQRLANYKCRQEIALVSLNRKIVNKKLHDNVAVRAERLMLEAHIGVVGTIISSLTKKG